MKLLFDEKKLAAIANQYSKAYQHNTPFPYIVIDNFIDDIVLQDVADSFPDPDQFEFYKYENPLEKKLAFDQLSKLPDPIQNLLVQLNSSIFLTFLEKLTGIEGLISDPYYRGGGIHQIVPGGKLDIHIDFNKHQKLKLDRRLNALIYLNRDWDESYGGWFELWHGEFKNNKHVLYECKEKVLPIFNRFVVFSTSEKSYHGHPDQLTCPPDRVRQSVATYYYTNGRPKHEDVDAHSTTFIARPGDDPELDDLRDKRNKGRLSSNVQSNTTS
ncbi:proline hydroxylase [Candidatus Marinamargulisbacteria bacterium SCGC AG-333-B06]|nr:proline hydroxylase [Candidatus Marinamargulisbacteria bacterium SCGC AG-333-B06]